MPDEGENCPKECTHETYHYCDDTGSHCDKHCTCKCKPCRVERKNPIQPDANGAKILSNNVVR